jgi:hypothetical protein
VTVAGAEHVQPLVIAIDAAERGSGRPTESTGAPLLNRNRCFLLSELCRREEPEKRWYRFAPPILRELQTRSNLKVPQWTDAAATYAPVILRESEGSSTPRPTDSSSASLEYGFAPVKPGDDSHSLVKQPRRFPRLATSRRASKPRGARRPGFCWNVSPSR